MDKPPLSVNPFFRNKVRCDGLLLRDEKPQIQLETLFLQYLVGVGVTPVANRRRKFILDAFVFGLFLLSNAFFAYCYIVIIFHCLPVKEEVVMSGENLYTASIGTSSCLIFISLWFRREKLCNMLKTLNDIRLTKSDKILIGIFHLITLIFLSLYTSVLVPAYAESMERCGASIWLHRLLGLSLTWNIYVISLPIVIVLTFSYIYKVRFCRVNEELKNYIIHNDITTKITFRKCKDVKSIKFKYNRLRRVQDDVERLLHMSVLGNHVFLLISLISTLLNLVVSVVENKDTVSYGVGVSASSFGMVVLLIKASIVEWEGREVSLPKQIILRREKPLSQSDDLKELESLVKLSEIKYRMKPGGLYVLDRQFILKMIGAASTYLLVSIQFYLTEKQSSGNKIANIS